MNLQLVDKIGNIIINSILWALVVAALVLFLGILSCATGHPVTKPNNPETIQHTLEQRYHVKYPESYFLASAIQEASETEGIDQDLLIAIIHQESGFKPTAKSPHGAYGYMQVMYIWGEICPYNRLNQYDNVLAGACAMKHSIVEGRGISNGLIIYNIGVTNYNEGINLLSGKSYRDNVLREQAIIKHFRREHS